jgi:phage replication initiation protein
LKDFEFKRVDIALDTYLREVTFETVSEAYASGLFTTCGKPPSMRSIVPFDLYEGRTIYVGKRDQPKYFRGYEKGYELIKDFPRHFNIDTLDGHKIADMFRCELELKAKNHHLPLDLLVNRDNYFSGAYPYLKTVLDVEPKVLRIAREENARRSLASMLEVLRNQYGNTLFTALAAHDGDIGAVWSKVVGFKHNERLLEDGVLMVNHD